MWIEQWLDLVGYEVILKKMCFKSWSEWRSRLMGSACSVPSPPHQSVCVYVNVCPWCDESDRAFCKPLAHCFAWWEAYLLDAFVSSVFRLKTALDVLCCTGHSLTLGLLHYYIGGMPTECVCVVCIHVKVCPGCGESHSSLYPCTMGSASIEHISEYVFSLKPAQNVVSLTVRFSPRLPVSPQEWPICWTCLCCLCSGWNLPAMWWVAQATL